MIAIIDYDAGNIKSVEKAVRKLGREPLLIRSAEKILAADHVILPGVGNFGDAMERLRNYELIGPIKQAVKAGIPFLGICLGEQLFFESSEESPGAEGLSLLKGKCLRFEEREGFKIPQIGWNSLHLQYSGRLFLGIPEQSYVYFVHSYYVKADELRCVKATCQYANIADASVESGNLFGCQFHPEKSGETGLRILRNFLEIKKEDSPC